MRYEFYYPLGRYLDSMRLYSSIHPTLKVAATDKPIGDTGIYKKTNKELVGAITTNYAIPETHYLYNLHLIAEFMDDSEASRAAKAYINTIDINT